MGDEYAVVILNWNGADDTIECLESLLVNDRTAVPIVVDNGSNDDSVIRIRKTLVDNYGEILELSVAGQMPFVTGSKSPVLVSVGENLGYAKGCNLGLKIAHVSGYENVVFLNNDTVVEDGSLTRMSRRLTDDQDVDVVIPLLLIHGTEKIWNCGGRVSGFGFRRYYYFDKALSEIYMPKEISCTFITGCCFVVRTGRFLERGGFTEKFFFGEEDFDFSIWMKDHEWKVICMTDSVVHHKVGVSIDKGSNNKKAPKIFVHYLNRLINMKARYGLFLWSFWLVIYTPYIVYVLLRYKIVGVECMLNYVYALIRKAVLYDSVSRYDFERIMRIGERTCRCDA